MTCPRCQAENPAQAHFCMTLVERLVLAGLTPAGPAWFAGHPDADLLDRAFVERMMAALAVDDWAAVQQAFLTQATIGEPGSRKLYEGALRAWSLIPPASLRNFFTLDDPGRDVRGLLPAIGVPTLVLHGERDALNPIALARRTAAQIPGAQLHVLAGRCHALLTTAAVEFADVVRRFIRAGKD